MILYLVLAFAAPLEEVRLTGKHCPLLADCGHCKAAASSLALSTPRSLHAAEAGCGRSEHSVAEGKGQHWTEKDCGRVLLLAQQLAQPSVVIPSRTIALCSTNSPSLCQSVLRCKKGTRRCLSACG